MVSRLEPHGSVSLVSLGFRELSHDCKQRLLLVGRRRAGILPPNPSPWGKSKGQLAGSRGRGWRAGAGPGSKGWEAGRASSAPGSGDFVPGNLVEQVGPCAQQGGEIYPPESVLCESSMLSGGALAPQPAQPCPCCLPKAGPSGLWPWCHHPYRRALSYRVPTWTGRGPCGQGRRPCWGGRLASVSAAGARPAPGGLWERRGREAAGLGETEAWRGPGLVWVVRGPTEISASCSHRRLVGAQSP